MEKGDHKFLKRTRGSSNGGYARARVQIGFDDEMLKAIEARAKHNNQSFAAEVRELVAIALSFERTKR